MTWQQQTGGTPSGLPDDYTITADGRLLVASQAERALWLGQLVPADDTAPIDTAGASRRVLENALLDRVWPLDCQRWREPDRPFEFGARAAIQCGEPTTGVAQVAFFQFPDAGSMRDFWDWRADQLDLARRGDDGGCADGRPGIGSVEYGEVACYVQRGVAKIRSIDERTMTYGVLDASGRDLPALHARWDPEDPSSLPPRLGGEAAPGEAEVSRAPRPAAQVTVTSLMQGGQERGPGYGISDQADVGPPAASLTGFRLDVRWRDRSEDEVGFRVVRIPVRAVCRSRSLAFEPTGRRVLIARVPADATRWKGRFQTSTRHADYASAWRIAVVAFNNDGASEAAIAGDDDIIGVWGVPRNCR